VHYIICHNHPILNVNLKMQTRKRLITYITINGIVALRKHVNSNHLNIFFNFEEKTNFPLKEDEKTFQKETKCFF